MSEGKQNVIEEPLDAIDKIIFPPLYTKLHYTLYIIHYKAISEGSKSSCTLYNVDTESRNIR